MEEKDILNFELKKKIEDHLKTINIDNFRTNFAQRDKFENRDIWKVNIEFFEKMGQAEFKSAAIMIDANTGEIKQFIKGSSWLS